MSLQHILKNSSVSGKEPLASQLANGELSINYHADGPFLCCKDTAGNVRRVAGVWVSATAPSTPFPGELWLDTSSTPTQLKVYKDTTDAWVFAGEVNTATTTTEGLVRLATDVDTQAGTNATSAVTPASLQSKISDSTSTVSSTTIASSSAVKTLADTVNAALPKSGGTITGTLEIGNTGQLRFEGSSNDAYETTLAVEDPTGTRTITLPDRTGTVITTGDTGTVTSTMIADSTIVNADINASAAIAHSKLAALNSAQVLLGNASNVPTATTVTGDVTISNAGVTSIASGVIVDADINSNAEIAVSKLADGSARQLLQTDAAGTGVEWTSDVDIPGTLDVTGATTLDSTLSVPLGSAAAPSINFAGDNTGIYSPGADQLAVSTGGTGRLFVDSAGNIGVGVSSPAATFGGGGGAVDASGPIISRGALNAELNSCGALQYDTNITTIRAYGSSAFSGVLAFATGGGGNPGGTGTTEHMRLTGDGRLGIGTSSPNFALHVVTSGAGEIRHADGTRAVAMGSTGSLSYIGSMTSGQDLALYAANGEKVRIDSSGNVGIGDSYTKSILTLTRNNNSTKPSDSASIVLTNRSSDLNGNIAGGIFADCYRDVANPSITAGIWFTRNSAEANLASTSNILFGSQSLATDALPAERMRLTSDGRLGIGTSSPSELLSVNNPGGSAAISVRTGGALLNSVIKFDADNTNFASVGLEDTSLVMRCDNSSTPAERMRITNSGRVLVNTSNAIGGTHGLQVVGNSGVQSAQILMRHPDASSGEFWQIGPDNGNNNFVVYNHAAAGLYITNGQNSWSSSSDERLKTDLVNIEDGLAKVGALRAVTGRFKTDPEGTSKSFLIAQDVLSVFPEPVDTQNPDKLGLAYTGMIPLLVAALKESKERIETLEAKVAALEAA